MVKSVDESNKRKDDVVFEYFDKITSNRFQMINAEIESLRTEKHNHHTRILKLENKCENFQTDMRNINQQTNDIKNSIKGINENLDTIKQHILKERVKKETYFSIIKSPLFAISMTLILLGLFKYIDFKSILTIFGS